MNRFKEYLSLFKVDDNVMDLIRPFGGAFGKL